MQAQQTDWEDTQRTACREIEKTGLGLPLLLMGVTLVTVNLRTGKTVLIHLDNPECWDD